jgi:hypothetical protein
MSRRRSRPGSPNHRPLSLRSSHWKTDGSAKVRFSDRAAALSIANQRAMEDGIQLNVYQCDFCTGWHLGSTAARAD